MKVNSRALSTCIHRVISESSRGTLVTADVIQPTKC